MVITPQSEYQIPFGVGIASDPMALRRGARKLPMEDVCFYQWPLSGLDQVLEAHAHALFISKRLHLSASANSS